MWRFRRRRAAVAVGSLVLLAVTCGSLAAHADSRLESRLRRELALAEAAVEIERGVEALEEERASTTFARAVMMDRASESVRKLRAYGTLRAAGEADTTERLRVLYQLARGGMPRLIAESRLARADGSSVAGAARLERGRLLHGMVRNDLRSLQRVRRSESRARAELISTSRELATVSALNMVASLQAAVLREASGQLSPDVRKARTRRLFTMSRTDELSSRERRLVRLVGRTYRTLNYGVGLDFLDYGSLQRPVNGRIVGRFGVTKDRLLGLTSQRDGVELAAPRRGGTVRAAADGRVLAVGDLPGYEEVVVVEHPDGFLSLTGHLRSVSVQVGQELKRGEAIGNVATKQLEDGLGRTVYFELRHGERPVNPTAFLRRR